jgi:prepilin-type N-terminal cleavage/methylation domain-containing protein
MIRPGIYNQSRPRPGSEVNILRPGFTLVELLVVIAIISLLLSILMPSLAKARSTACRLKCAHNLKQINLAVNMYLNDNEDTYLCAQDPLPVGYWLWMGRGWRSFLESYLTTRINKDNPSVLFCPEDPADKDKYEATSYAYSMAFYHSPEQIDAMSNPADTYGPTAQPSIPQQCDDVANPSGKILIGEWSSNHAHINETDNGWWIWQGRRNFLCADGHIRFLRATDIRPACDGLPDANLTFRGIKGTDWPR